MKKIIASAITLLTAAGIALGGVNPADTGSAQSRNSIGISIDQAWAAGNPALVGLDVLQRNRLTLLSTSLGMWNDKIALPLSNMFSVKSYVTELMRESFGIRSGLSPDEVSQKLTDELRDGIYLCAGVRNSPVDYASRGFGFSIKVYGDADIKVPGGLFMPFFSATEGLLVGNKLDLSEARMSEISATEIGFKLGRSVAIPFIDDYTRLDEGAVGVNVKALIGHNYININANGDGAIYYDSVSNRYISTASLDLLSAKVGYGLGLDVGTVFHNDNHAVSVDILDIGMIQWDKKSVRRGKITLGDLDLNKKDSSDFFDVGPLTSGDSGYAMWLPMSLNVGYLYHLDLSPYYGIGIGAILNYLSASLGYNQQLLLGPGKNTYSPRFSAGATLGFLGGYLPVSYGITVGGAEKLASTAGLEFGKSGSFGLYYKATGSPILLPRNGFEVAFSQTTVWGSGKVKTKEKPQKKPLLPIHPVDIDTTTVSPTVPTDTINTDTLTVPPTVPADTINADTLTVPPTIPADTINTDTLTVPPTIPADTINTDTLTVPPTIPADTIINTDTLTVPPTIPAKPVEIDTLTVPPPTPPTAPTGTVEPVTPPLPPAPKPEESLNESELIKETPPAAVKEETIDVAPAPPTPER